MKKAILIIALMGATTLGFGQVKNPVDTVQMYFDKEVAKVVLSGLQAAQTAAGLSKNISAFDGNQAINVTNFFIEAIYKKWPDLVPKKPAGQ